LRLKTDSFVVGSDTHFPTDYNLLWDSARMCINIVGKLQVPGWRKAVGGRKRLKALMPNVRRASRGGGKNKADRIKVATQKIVAESQATCP
jgi:IS5 family transposase